MFLPWIVQTPLFLQLPMILSHFRSLGQYVWTMLISFPHLAYSSNIYTCILWKPMSPPVSNDLKYTLLVIFKPKSFPHFLYKCADRSILGGISR